MKYLLIALLWTAYCTLHSYLISIRFTNLMQRILKKYFAFYRLFYVLLSLILLIPLINYTLQLTGNKAIVNDGIALEILRYILSFGSMILFFRAFFFDYDVLSFFGIRQILSFGKPKKISHPEDFKRSGLLGIIRHPMYLALIIYLWSQTRSLTDIVVSSVLTIYILVGTRLEEKKLVLEFGESYINYQKEVPMLIPFTKIKARK